MPQLAHPLSACSPRLKSTTASTPGSKYSILLANIFFVQNDPSGVQILKFKFEFFLLILSFGVSLKLGQRILFLYFINQVFGKVMFYKLFLAY